VYKVLIVEDEDLIRKGLVFSFDWLSYDCVIVGEAENGRKGLESIHSLKPDIVVTDIRMPIMDGIEMLGTLQDRGFETIIITGYAEFRYAKKAIQFGVSEFLLKPVNHLELGEVLEKIISKVKKKHIVETIQEKAKPFSEISILDMEIYLHETSYDSRYVPRVLDFIIENYGSKISIDQIADDLGVSGTCLSKKFKEETKHTFNEFLNRYRIQKALEYMRDGDLRIYEIAELVGFSEYKYFSQVFKNYTKYTPSDFMQTEIFIRKAER
jgi:two-component system response regulator YesN